MKSSKIILETERLILRPFCDNDACELYKYASDADVAIPAGWPPHKSIEESLKFIRGILSMPRTFAVCLKEDNKVIGSVMLHRMDVAEDDDEYDFGYWLGKQFWGRGIIPEAAREVIRYAFDECCIERVYAVYSDGNVQSRRVQEKLGFIYHSTIEDYRVSALDETRVAYVMLLTRAEWEKNTKGGS